VLNSDFADKRAERSVREESETAAHPTADGPHQEHEAEEENGPDQPDHDRGAVAVPGHGIPAGHTGPAERHTGKVFLPHVLQPVRRADGHAGAAERVAQLRVLLLHEQTVPRGVRPAVQGPAERRFQAQQHTGDVRIGFGRGLTASRHGAPDAGNPPAAVQSSRVILKAPFRSAKRARARTNTRSYCITADVQIKLYLE